MRNALVRWLTIAVLGVAISGARTLGAAETVLPLTERGLANEVAFARLLGYVRHFHPSDEAAAADWTSLAADGAQRVEAQPDAAALAAELQAVFAPVAPTVRVFVTGQRPVLPPELNPSVSAEARLTRWHHFGYAADGYDGIFHSERVTRGVVAGRLPDGFPDPGEPFAADLGGGVSCLVPLALYADIEGTLPHRRGDAPTYTAAPDPGDRARRLAGVVLAWNVLQHFDPHIDAGATDWRAEPGTALRAAATCADEAASLHALRRLAAALPDNQAFVVSLDSIGEPRGFLPIAWDWIEDRLVITHVSDLAPSGLARGDVVLSVDGTPLASLLAETEPRASGAPPRWVRFPGVVAMTACSAGRSATLRVASGQESSGFREVVVRCEAEVPTFEPHPPLLQKIGDGIIYVDLTAMSDADWELALPTLATARGLVLDLRGYPRLQRSFLAHLSSQPLAGAARLVPVVDGPERERMRFLRVGESELAPAAPTLTANRAFLSCGGAPGYVALYLEIVERYGLGDIVGDASAGPNGDLNATTIPGYLLTFTGTRVPNHDPLLRRGTGVRSTLPVARTRGGVAVGRDEVLDRAVQLVKSRL
jgi:hypothetical protein